ncbi:TRAP transporter substrate-binding protein [Oceanibium sediminis]|uniref:TRAP transporter substrate-binding protein n=1 Tax=Oceanibium sediminis TaxID=2026339 RepID=UPI000DD3E130|nr:TRAP transporter substrate-binding protein [Oceanibium sediminis]
MKKQTLALTTAMALTMSGAMAQDITLRISHWIPATHPIASEGLVSWTNAITEQSGGAIQFQIFPSAQLGKAEDHYDMARDGVVDIAWLNPGFNPGRFSIFAGIQVPLTVADGMTGIGALNDWYGPLSEQEMGDVHFCLAHMLAPITFHTTDKPVATPSDLSGMKIRPSSAMEASFIRQAGGSAVPGANPEAREMLSRGLIDGTTGTVDAQFQFGVMDAVTYHTDVPFSAVSFALVMNKDRYEGLPDDARAAIDNNCGKEGALAHFASPQEYELAAMERLRALEDHEVVEVGPEALAEWIAGAEPVREAWRQELSDKGIDPAPIEASLRETLSAAGALLE